MSTHPSIPRILIAPLSPTTTGTKDRTDSSYTSKPSYIFMVWNIYQTGNFIGYELMVFVLLLVRPGHLAFVRNVTSVRRNTNTTKRGWVLTVPDSPSLHIQHKAIIFLSRPDRGQNHKVPPEIHIKLQTHKHHLLAAHHNNVQLS